MLFLFIIIKGDEFMKKVKVSDTACIGCGACVAIDPEHFEFNDNGLSEAISQDNLETAELQNAIESCPTAAISVIEVTDSCECKNCDCEECNCGEECNCEETCECSSETCECEECNCEHCDCHE